MPHSDGPSADTSRRQLLVRSATLAAMIGPGAALLSSCAAGSSPNPGAGGNATPLGGADNPFNAKASDPLQVYIFNGGYGDTYAAPFENTYRKKFPGANVSQQSGQNVTGDLQPRFNSGNPPDVIDDSGAYALKLDVLHTNGELTDLQQLLNAPSIDDPKTKVRDTLLPGTISAGTFGSSMYALNYAFTVYGLWYSSTTWQQNGWQVPKTWDEFMTLCATIKASGKMAPFTFQGKYPGYMVVPLMDMVAKNGGVAVQSAIDNLEPNAWRADAVRNAVEAIYMLVDRGYTLPGSQGLNNTQSQTLWNQYKAAVVPCGSWLENEQLAATPAGFGMAAFAMPSLDGDVMPQGSIRATASETFIVPARAKNVAGGLELMRIMCSKAGGAAFAQNANSLSVVKDSITPDVAAKLKPGTRSSSQLYQAAGPDNIITWYYNTWYSKLETDIENAMGQLMSNAIKPADFINLAQAAADKCARDSSIQKFKRPTSTQ